MNLHRLRVVDFKTPTSSEGETVLARQRHYNIGRKAQSKPIVNTNSSGCDEQGGGDHIKSDVNSTLSSHITNLTKRRSNSRIFNYFTQSKFTNAKRKAELEDKDFNKSYKADDCSSQKSRFKTFIRSSLLNLYAKDVKKRGQNCAKNKEPTNIYFSVSPSFSRKSNRRLKIEINSRGKCQKNNSQMNNNDLQKYCACDSCTGNKSQDSIGRTLKKIKDALPKTSERGSQNKKHICSNCNYHQAKVLRTESIEHKPERGSNLYLRPEDCHHLRYFKDITKDEAVIVDTKRFTNKKTNVCCGTSKCKEVTENPQKPPRPTKEKYCGPNTCKPKTLKKETLGKSCNDGSPQKKYDKHLSKTSTIKISTNRSDTVSQRHLRISPNSEKKTSRRKTRKIKDFVKCCCKEQSLKCYTEGPFECCKLVHSLKRERCGRDQLEPIVNTCVRVRRFTKHLFFGLLIIVWSPCLLAVFLAWKIMCPMKWNSRHGQNSKNLSLTSLPSTCNKSCKYFRRKGLLSTVTNWFAKIIKRTADSCNETLSVIKIRRKRTPPCLNVLPGYLKYSNMFNNPSTFNTVSQNLQCDVPRYPRLRQVRSLYHNMRCNVSPHHRLRPNLATRKTRKHRIKHYTAKTGHYSASYPSYEAEYPSTSQVNMLSTQREHLMLRGNTKCSLSKHAHNTYKCLHHNCFANTNVIPHFLFTPSYMVAAHCQCLSNGLVCYRHAQSTNPISKNVSTQPNKTNKISKRPGSKCKFSPQHRDFKRATIKNKTESMHPQENSTANNNLLLNSLHDIEKATPKDPVHKLPTLKELRESPCKQLQDISRITTKPYNNQRKTMLSKEANDDVINNNTTLLQEYLLTKNSINRSTGKDKNISSAAKNTSSALFRDEKLYKIMPLIMEALAYKSSLLSKTENCDSVLHSCTYSNKSLIDIRDVIEHLSNKRNVPFDKGSKCSEKSNLSFEKVFKSSNKLIQEKTTRLLKSFKTQNTGSKQLPRSPPKAQNIDRTITSLSKTTSRLNHYQNSEQTKNVFKNPKIKETRAFTAINKGAPLIYKSEIELTRQSSKCSSLHVNQSTVSCQYQLFAQGLTSKLRSHRKLSLRGRKKSKENIHTTSEKASYKGYGNKLRSGSFLKMRATSSESLLYIEHEKISKSFSSSVSKSNYNEFNYDEMFRRYSNTGKWRNKLLNSIRPSSQIFKNHPRSSHWISSDCTSLVVKTFSNPQLISRTSQKHSVNTKGHQKDRYTYRRYSHRTPKSSKFHRTPTSAFLCNNIRSNLTPSVIDKGFYVADNKQIRYLHNSQHLQHQGQSENFEPSIRKCFNTHDSLYNNKSRIMCPPGNRTPEYQIKIPRGGKCRSSSSSYRNTMPGSQNNLKKTVCRCATPRHAKSSSSTAQGILYDVKTKKISPHRLSHDGYTVTSLHSLPRENPCYGQSKLSPKQRIPSSLTRELPCDAETMTSFARRIPRNVKPRNSLARAIPRYPKSRSSRSSSPRGIQPHGKSGLSPLHENPCYDKSRSSPPRSISCHAKSRSTPTRKIPYYAKSLSSSPQRMPCHVKTKCLLPRDANIMTSTPRRMPCYVKSKSTPRIPCYTKSRWSPPREIPCYIKSKSPSPPRTPRYTKSRSSQLPEIPCYIKSKSSQSPRTPEYSRPRSSLPREIPSYIKSKSPPSPRIPRYTKESRWFPPQEIPYYTKSKSLSPREFPSYVKKTCEICEPCISRKRLRVKGEHDQKKGSLTSIFLGIYKVFISIARFFCLPCIYLRRLTRDERHPNAIEHSKQGNAWTQVSSPPCKRECLCKNSRPTILSVRRESKMKSLFPGNSEYNAIRWRNVPICSHCQLQPSLSCKRESVNNSLLNKSLSSESYNSSPSKPLPIKVSCCTCLKKQTNKPCNSGNSLKSTWLQCCSYFKKIFKSLCQLVLSLIYLLRDCFYFLWLFLLCIYEAIACLCRKAKRLYITYNLIQNKTKCCECPRRPRSLKKVLPQHTRSTKRSDRLRAKSGVSVSTETPWLSPTSIKCKSLLPQTCKRERVSQTTPLLGTICKKCNMRLSTFKEERTCETTRSLLYNKCEMQSSPFRKSEWIGYSTATPCFSLNEYKIQSSPISKNEFCCQAACARFSSKFNKSKKQSSSVCKCEVGCQATRSRLLLNYDKSGKQSLPICNNEFGCQATRPRLSSICKNEFGCQATRNSICRNCRKQSSPICNNEVGCQAARRRLSLNYDKSRKQLSSICKIWPRLSLNYDKCRKQPSSICRNEFGCQATRPQLSLNYDKCRKQSSSICKCEVGCQATRPRLSSICKNEFECQARRPGLSSICKNELGCQATRTRCLSICRNCRKQLSPICNNEFGCQIRRPCCLSKCRRCRMQSPPISKRDDACQTKELKFVSMSEKNNKSSAPNNILSTNGKNEKCSKSNKVLATHGKNDKSSTSNNIVSTSDKNEKSSKSNKFERLRQATKTCLSSTCRICGKQLSLICKSNFGCQVRRPCCSSKCRKYRMQSSHISDVESQTTEPEAVATSDATTGDDKSSTANKFVSASGKNGKKIKSNKVLATSDEKDKSSKSKKIVSTSDKNGKNSKPNKVVPSSDKNDKSSKPKKFLFNRSKNHKSSKPKKEKSKRGKNDKSSTPNKFERLRQATKSWVTSICNKMNLSLAEHECHDARPCFRSTSSKNNTSSSTHKRERASKGTKSSNCRTLPISCYRDRGLCLSRYLPTLSLFKNIFPPLPKLSTCRVCRCIRNLFKFLLCLGLVILLCPILMCLGCCFGI